MKEEQHYQHQQGGNYFLTSRALSRISSQSASSLLKTIHNTKKDSLSKMISQNDKNTIIPLSTTKSRSKLTLNLNQEEAQSSFFSHRVQPSPSNYKRTNLTSSPLSSLDSPSFSSSLSFQQYRDLLSNSSPAVIHLPARRLQNQARITEDTFPLPIQTGFISFYKIKAENQDFLINLHDQRQSVSELVDLQQLQISRQIAKKNADLEYRRVSNFNNNHHRQSLLGKPNNSPSRFNYENRDQMELELKHNRSMLEQFSKHTQIQAMQSFTQAQSAFQDTQDKMLKMPPIRKYPLQRRKEQVDTSNVIPIGEEEFDKNHPDNKRIDQLVGSSMITIHKVLFYNIPQEEWRPCAREGSTFVIDRTKAYLFGGMGQYIFDSLEVVELEQQLHWKTVEHVSSKISVPAARYGHTMNLFKGNLVIFGGEREFNPNFKEKSCLFDVHLFNIDQQKWQLLNNTSGEIPQARRCHAATIIGRQLIVHGGSNSRDAVLSDLWAFDLGTCSWQELSTHDQETAMLSTKHFASAHGCCNVFYPSKANKLQLFKSQDIKIPKWVPQIIFEGIYYFGGKDETGKATNKLRVLKIDCKPVQWIVPQTYGKSPAARYQHIVENVCVLNLIVVYGGKNDAFDDPREVYLSDLHILQIDSLCWVQVELNSNIPPVPRANHSAVVYDTKLLIFGGLNQHGYLPSQIQLIELDSNLSRQMIRKEQAQRLDADVDYPINDKSPSAGLRKLHQNGIITGLSSPQATKSIQLDWSQVMNNNNTSKNHKYHDYKEIPFSSKTKVAEKQPTEEQRVIEKLTYKNFPSFLPQPKRQSISHLKLRSLSQAKDSDGNPLNDGSSRTPTQRLQKTVSKIAILQSVVSKMNHA